MADLRTGATGSSLVPQSPAGGGRSEAVRAAQRAFFQAALSGAPEVSRLAPVAPAQQVRADTSAAPSRLLRPGSLLDIKV